MSFINYCFRNKQANVNNLTFCFLGTFFWIPIPVNQYEQFALHMAVRSPLGDLYSYKLPQPIVCARNPFWQILTKGEDLSFWERIDLPVLEESSPLYLLYMSVVFGHFDIQNKMADMVPHFYMKQILILVRSVFVELIYLSGDLKTINCQP